MMELGKTKYRVHEVYLLQSAETYFSDQWLNDKLFTPGTPNTVNKEQDVDNKTLVWKKQGEEHSI